MQCVDDGMVRRLGVPAGTPGVFCSTDCLSRAWAAAAAAAAAAACRRQQRQQRRQQRRRGL
jgi:hypothetical protein